MPKLHLKDGRVLDCKYSQASTINDILTGQPTDKVYNAKVLELATKTDHVEFEPIDNRGQYEHREIEKDPRLHELMDNKALKGYAKFKAIGDYIKNKNACVKEASVV